MPPVLDTLRAIFPDILPQQVSNGDDSAAAVGGTEQGNLQSAENGSQSYNSRIHNINAKYSTDVETSSHQQQYLRLQQDQARKADEDSLIQADSDYTPGWRKAGLPIKSSHLTLDPLQIQQGGLANPKLVLSQYATHNTKEVLSPLRVTEHNQAGADPHYCSLTSNLQVRNKLVPAKRRAEAGQGTTWRALPQDDLKARLAASSVRRRALSNTMPKDQWDLEKKIIDSMHHKLTFLHNPRFPSPQKHNRGIAADPSIAESAKLHGSSRHGSPCKVTRAGLPQAAFRAEPRQVLFRDCEVGQSYQQLMTLHNCTPISQRLMLIPSSTPFLSFSNLVYASASPEPGLVAPGMHVGVTVTFTPNSLHDVDDVMVLETAQGSLQVPLLARRDPPLLSLPEQIVIGPTLMGNTQVVSIMCTNSGGPGQFSIFGQGQDPASPELDKGIRLGPFEVIPADFALERGEMVQLSVAFTPAAVGQCAESFALLCDNSTSTAYQLSGTGSEVQVHLTGLDGRPLAEAEHTQPIWFGHVAVGAAQTRVVRVQNATQLPLPFCWQQTDEPVSEGAQHAQHEMTDGRFGAMQFHAEPAVGILEAGAAADITFKFSPDSQHRFLSWAQLMVDTSVPGTSSIPMYTERMLEVALEGCGDPCTVALWPPLIRYPTAVEVGQVVKQALTVSNPGRAVAHVTFTSSDPAVTLQPTGATVVAGGEEQIEVVITGSQVGQVQAEVVCSVEHGNSQVVSVMATVTGPRVEFEDPGLIFGLVQLGTQVSQQITIHNPSQYSSASWTLQELPQPGSSAASTSVTAPKQPNTLGSTGGEGNLNPDAQQAQQGTEVNSRGVLTALRQKSEQLVQQLQQGQDATQAADAGASHQKQLADSALGPQLLLPDTEQLPAPEAQSQSAAQHNAGADTANTTSSRLTPSSAGLAAVGAMSLGESGLSNPFEGVEAVRREEAGLIRIELGAEMGLLAPGASTTIQVLLDAGSEGVLNTTLELFTKGGAKSYLSVAAAVIAPALALTPTQLDLGVTHLGVPRVCSLTLSNLTMLPTSFTWEAFGSGGVGLEGGEMSVTVDPVQGLLEPGQQLPIQATFTPTVIGPAEALIACCTAGPNPPAGFSTVSHVQGLSVTYHIQPGPLLTPGPPPLDPNRPTATAVASTRALPGDSDAQPAAGSTRYADKRGLKRRQAVRADFGECSIGDTKSVLLTISNETPIAGSVIMWLDTFQADLSTMATEANAALSASKSAAPISPNFASGMAASSRSHALLPSLTAGKAGSPAQNGALSLTLSSPVSGMASTSGHTSHRGHKAIAGRIASLAGCSLKGRQTLATLTLSKEAERSRPFASALGQLMMTQQTSQAVAKQVAGEKGLAVGVSPSQGWLPPGGSFTCTLTCTTDMCGDYVDVLHVQVGDLAVKKIPVHISVVGTPLIMQLGRILLPGFPRNPMAAQPLAQPLARLASRSLAGPAKGKTLGPLQAANKEVPAGMALDFGQLLANSPAERTFHVFNTSSVPVQLDWTFYRYGLPGPLESSQGPQNPPVRVVAVHCGVDEAVGTVSLSTTVLANLAEHPFKAEPRSAVIAGNSSAKVTVSFSAPDAMLHAGYLLGTQRVLPPESRVTLRCSVGEDADSDEQDEAEEGDGGDSQVGSGRGVPLGACTGPAGDSTHAEEIVPLHDRRQNPEEEVRESVTGAYKPLVTCHISGGFHPFAGRPSAPLQPLRVNVNAAVIQPHLEPEFPDGTDHLSFVCHASDDATTHPSYKQTLVLTNMHSCPLQFSLGMAAAGAEHFQIQRADCSSVSQLGGLQPRPLLATLATSRGNKQSNESGDGSRRDSLMLRPHEHVSVCVQYMPQAQLCRDETALSAADGPNLSASAANVQSTPGNDMLSDESASDQLMILYSNGHQQTVPVTACCLHPVLQASAVRLDFGAVHIQSPKTLEVELSNPSLVDATWSAQIGTAGFEAGAAASVSFAQGGQRAAGLGPAKAALPSGKTAGPDKAAVQQRSDASAPFTVAPSSGRLTGRGLAMPKTQKLLVTWAPKQTGLCTAELSVVVAQGQTVKIALSGLGTYNEAHEVAANLKGLLA